MSPPQLRTVPHFLVVIVGAIALAFLLTCVGSLLDRYDSWRTAQRAQLAQAQDRQSERSYIAWVHSHCGPETWWKPRADGALACTDKRGRSTGQVLVEAQP